MCVVLHMSELSILLQLICVQYIAKWPHLKLFKSL